jgi:hypothetical protein
MGLLGDIEKLITEHGSAAILREKVSLLDLQRSTAIAERDSLATQLAKAKTCIETSEADKAQLQAELDEARQEIKLLKQSSARELPEESEQMLVVIANASESLSKDQVIHHLRLPQARGDYFFDQLLTREFVNPSHGQMGRGWFYRATAAGREYLAKAGLL